MGVPDENGFARHANGVLRCGRCGARVLQGQSSGGHIVMLDQVNEMHFCPAMAERSMTVVVWARER